MKKLLALLFLLGALNIQAQNSLSGKITDNKNNPLIGVDIYVTEFHKGTVTDINGEYTLKNLPNGEVKIIFSYIGYETINKVVNFNNKSLTFNTSLTESVFKIDEVIISTPFNKLQSENVMKVDRLTAAAIRKTGAPTLIAGLEKVAGVSQISTGTSIGKPVIRGLSGNRVLVYAQGVRLENQQFGDEHGLGLNDEGIESVEVIKGPASLLYGSDALGGVIYINPERFAATNTTGASFSQKLFSNTLGSNSSVGFKSSSESWKLLGRISSNFHADYKTPNNGRVTNTRYRENDIKIGIGYNSEKYSNEFRYNYNYSTLGIPHGFEEQTVVSLPEEPFQEIGNHILSLHNHFFFGNSKLDVDLGYIVNNRNEFEEHHDEHDDEHDEHEEEHFVEEAPALQMKLKTFNFNVKYHLPRFNNGFESILGVQGMRQTNKNFGEELLIPNAKINDIGVFYTANKQWDNSSFQAGIRFDSRSLETEEHVVEHDGEEHQFDALDNSYTSFTTSIGYKFELFNKITTRINTASGFRAPNLAELTSHGVHHGTNRFEEGNADLKNEKNLQLDISLEYKTSHIEFFGNAFYNRLNDYIYLNPTGEIEDGAPVYEYTQNNAKLYGGEFGFHLHPHPIDWLHLENSFEMVIGKQDNGDYLSLIPATKINTTVRAEFDSGKWIKNGYAAIAVNSFLAQNNTSNFETPTSSYNLTSFNVGGDFNINEYLFSASVNINNLFDVEYVNHLSRLKSDGIFNMGRNITASLMFNF